MVSLGPVDRLVWDVLACCRNLRVAVRFYQMRVNRNPGQFKVISIFHFVSSYRDGLLTLATGKPTHAIECCRDNVCL